VSETSRRDFVRQAASALVAGTLAGCGRAHAAPAPANILSFDVGALTADGQSRVEPEHGPDGAPILVVREAANDFRAFSMQCTHEGCPLNPPAAGKLTCPCHGSQFDLAGNVLKGPAAYPLGQYHTRYDEKEKRLTVVFG